MGSMCVIFLFLKCIFVCVGQYADPVADLLDQWGVFRARLFRESCVFHRGNYVKDLSRLGRELNNVIIVDNSPASYIFHPENAVSLLRRRYGTLSCVFLLGIHFLCPLNGAECGATLIKFFCIALRTSTA